jgi:hypothetical protein
MVARRVAQLKAIFQADRLNHKNRYFTERVDCIIFIVILRRFRSFGSCRADRHCKGDIHLFRHYSEMMDVFRSSVGTGLILPLRDPRVVTGWKTQWHARMNLALGAMTRRRDHLI